MFPNYYKILKLSNTASKEEIKKAFRKLALELHPDRNKNEDAHERFIEVNQAYLILHDDDAREKYDREFERVFAPTAPHRNTSSPNQANSNQTSNTSSESSHEQKDAFKDRDLNDWAKKARAQSSEFARMGFDDFSKMAFGIVKETGFQLGNSLLVFFGQILSMSGVVNIIMGLSTGGNLGNPILGIALLVGGILLWQAATKNWKNH